MNILQPANSSATATTKFSCNDTIYKYHLEKFIGRGSFGEVWLAVDRAVGCRYAIKILRPGQQNIAERLNEAYIGHSLQHDNVVRIHNADVVDDLVILSMDYMPDGPVTRHTNASGFLPLPELVRVSTDLLRGLDYFHSRNLLHNDVKPENLLIGPGGRAMLTDYGIVEYTPFGSTVSPQCFYTLHAAPEVLTKRQMTAQTDIYQAGLTIFRLAVGLSSLQGKKERLGSETFEQLAKKGKAIEKKDFPAWVPNKLRQIILKAASDKLEKRYKNALDMRRDLEKLGYPGFWTSDSNGRLIGKNSRYNYSTEMTGSATIGYDLTATKINLASNNRTRVRSYCGSKMPLDQAKQMESKFFKAVIEGSA